MLGETRATPSTFALPAYASAGIEEGSC